jgi:hypothetical protein
MTGNSENQIIPIPSIPSTSISTTTELPVPTRYHCWGCESLKLRLDSEKFSRGHIPVCLKKNHTISINIFRGIPNWCPTDGEFKDEGIIE